MAAETFPNRLAGGLRRVTTGVDGRGKAVVVADERVTGDELGMLLWSADAPPVAGCSDAPPASGWWPPPGGIRVSLSSRRPDREAIDADAQQRTWPDINDAAGFHASDSADIIVMISGRISLELDDGMEVELKAGDVLIQNGTRHRWHNHGDEWPIMAVVIVGAQGESAATSDSALVSSYPGGLAVLVDEYAVGHRARGIFIAPAHQVGDADVATMVAEGKGICTVTLNESTAMRLGLHPQGSPGVGDAPYFAVSVEAAACTETGISARERATTIRALGNPEAVAADLVSPGHIMVQVARNILRDGATLPETANALLSAMGVARFAAWIDILDSNGDVADPGYCRTLATRIGVPCYDAARVRDFAREKLAAWDAAVRFSQSHFDRNA